MAPHRTRLPPWRPRLRAQGTRPSRSTFCRDRRHRGQRCQRPIMATGLRASSRSRRGADSCRTVTAATRPTVSPDQQARPTSRLRFQRCSLSGPCRAPPSLFGDTCVVDANGEADDHHDCVTLARERLHLAQGAEQPIVPSGGSIPAARQAGATTRRPHDGSAASARKRLYFPSLAVLLLLIANSFDDDAARTPRRGPRVAFLRRATAASEPPSSSRSPRPCRAAVVDDEGAVLGYRRFARSCLLLALDSATPLDPASRFHVFRGSGDLRITTLIEPLPDDTARPSAREVAAWRSVAALGLAVAGSGAFSFFVPTLPPRNG